MISKASITKGMKFSYTKRKKPIVKRNPNMLTHGKTKMAVLVLLRTMGDGSHFAKGFITETCGLNSIENDTICQSFERGHGNL